MTDTVDEARTRRRFVTAIDRDRLRRALDAVPHWDMDDDAVFVAPDHDHAGARWCDGSGDYHQFEYTEWLDDVANVIAVAYEDAAE